MVLGFFRINFAVAKTVFLWYGLYKYSVVNYIDAEKRSLFDACAGFSLSDCKKAAEIRRVYMRYRISDLAKLLDVSTNTVRRYEEMGYVNSVRDEKSGYRYYDDDSIFGITNTKLLRKYGSSHNEIEALMNCNLAQTIESYEQKIKELEHKIEFMTYVKNRMGGDLQLMYKAQSEEKVYEKVNVGFNYVLYKEGDRLLKEPERLKKVQEFLYDSPEIQRIYVMRKNDVESGNMHNIGIGYAIKQRDMEKYGMTENEYTESYPPKESIMSVVKMPMSNSKITEIPNCDLKEMIIGKHLRYMDKNNLKIAGDLLAVLITSAVDCGEDIQYMLVSIPVEQK